MALRAGIYEDPALLFTLLPFGQLVWRQDPTMCLTIVATHDHPLGALQILLLILVLIVIAQNLETTSIDVLFWTLASLPKLVLILISMVVGALVWEGLRRKLLKPDRARGATVTSRTHP